MSVYVTCTAECPVPCDGRCRRELAGSRLNPADPELYRQVRKPEPQPEAPRRQIMARSAASMKMRAPTWLWDKRIPSNALTLLAGREGIGKSTTCYDIMSRLTWGTLEGCQVGKPCGIGIIDSENDWETVILPRLVASGANVGQVHELLAVEKGRKDSISTPDDLEALAEQCRELNIRMLLLDPIMSVIPGHLDTHKDREVRQALEPLQEFAGKQGIAVVGLIHANKSGGTDALNTLMASRAFSAVPRSVLYAVQDPDDESEQRFLLGHPKSNLGPRQPSLTYGIEQVKVELDEPGAPPILTSRIRWEGTDRRSMADVLSAASEKKRERVSGQLGQELLAWIGDQGRTVTTAEVAEAFPDTKPETVRQNLARLEKRGELTKVAHGHYAIAARKSDSQSDSSLETFVMSQLSHLSQRKIEVTPVTDVTPGEAVTTVSQRWDDEPSDEDLLYALREFDMGQAS